MRMPQSERFRDRSQARFVYADHDHFVARRLRPVLAQEHEFPIEQGLLQRFGNFACERQ